MQILLVIVTCFAMKFTRKCQPFLHITPSAVLVLLWNYLMYFYYFSLSHFTGWFVDEVAPATWYKYGLVIIHCTLFWLFHFSFIWSVS